MAAETNSKRFRVAKGKMVVIKPDNASSHHSVLMIYDKENDAVGIQITDTELKGYCIFVSRSSLEQTRERGVEVDAIKRC